MKTFSIITLGCKVNQYESDAIRRHLETLGWAFSTQNGPTDLCIVNTCAVTAKAAMQSRQAVRRVIRHHPNTRIWVTGCYAQVEPEGLQEISGVHAIIGHGEKHRIGELVDAGLEKQGPFPVNITRDIFREDKFQQFPVPASGERTRPVLKIQDGCNTFCTYCIVPHARGRSRSMRPEDVITHIHRLWDSGYKEIVLSGIHLGAYGGDLSPETDLAGLLRRIDELPAGPRIRLSSIEPHEVSEDIIRLVAGSDRFCRHFHIPLQSGDDTILARMHRPYTRELFRDLILGIRDRMPDAAIGVDVLVGFPGETDEAFENTYRLIQDLPVTYLHVFPFSSRKGTPAHTYTNKVSGTIIKNRCRRIRTLGLSKKHDFYSASIGKRLETLLETGRDEATGMLKGITSNYIAVRMHGDDEMKNTIVHAQMIDFFDAEILVGAL